MSAEFHRRSELIAENDAERIAELEGEILSRDKRIEHLNNYAKEISQQNTLLICRIDRLESTCRSLRSERKDINKIIFEARKLAKHPLDGAEVKASAKRIVRASFSLNPHSQRRQS